MAEGIVHIGRAKTRRPPQTEEEVKIVYDLDMNAFDELTEMWNERSKKRDPAYLVWGTRRHFFRHFWGEEVEYPEARPAIGSQPVLCRDRSRPWYVPGLENLKRKWYPMGWDDYVIDGVKPVRRSNPATSVTKTSGGSATPLTALDMENESAQLSAAKKELKAIEDKKALYEIEKRKLTMELETAVMAKEIDRQKKALAEMEAGKVAIKASTVASGQHGNRDPVASAPSATSKLVDSKWNVPAKQPAIPLGRDEDFPRLGMTSTLPKVQVVPGAKAALPTVAETAVQRERRILGWEHRVEKKPGGTRQGMGRGPSEIIVSTLKKKWITHFQVHKEIVLKIKKETQCELTPVYEGNEPFWEMKIEGKEGRLSASPQKALEMMICYAEEIMKQEGSSKKNYYDTKSEAEKDFTCHNCGAAGHYKSACPKLECRNCGKKGHDVRKCPKPPKLTGLCFKCGKPGHKEMDCRSGKNHPATSTASQHEKSTSQASGHREVEKAVADSIKWKTGYKEGLTKQDEEDRVTAIDRIFELVVKLGDDKPLPQVRQLNQQPTSALLDQVKALELRLLDRDGPPKNEMVFRETHKPRKVAVVSKEKDIAPGKDSIGQTASVDAPETASKATKDQVAKPEKGKDVDSKQGVSVGPSASSGVQSSRPTKEGSPVSEEKVKVSWASDQDSNAGGDEPGKS